MTQFQEKLLQICSGDLLFSKEEQAFFDKYFDPPLPEEPQQIITPDETLKGVKRSNYNVKNYNLITKEINTINEEFDDNKSDSIWLKKHFEVVARFVRRHEDISNKEVLDNAWNTLERLLLYYKPGRTASIDWATSCIKKKITKYREEKL